MPAEAIKKDTIMKTAEGQTMVAEHDGSTVNVGQLKLNFGIEQEDDPIPAAIPETSDWNTPCLNRKDVDQTTQNKIAVDETTARGEEEKETRKVMSVDKDEAPSPQKSDNLPAAHE